MSADDRFRAIVDAHGSRVLAYLTRRCEPPADAADVMQAVLVTLWRKMDRVPDIEDPTPWLIGVARHELANHRRASQRRLAATNRLKQTLETVVMPPEDNEDPRVARLNEAIRALKPADRELVQLIYWDDLTSDQAAIVLGISAAAARKRLQRTRALLQEAIGPATPRVGDRVS